MTLQDSNDDETYRYDSEDNDCVVLILDDRFMNDGIYSRWMKSLVMKTQQAIKPFQTIALFDSEVINDHQNIVDLPQEIPTYVKPYYDCLIFENHIRPVIEKVVDGYDGCLSIITRDKSNRRFFDVQKKEGLIFKSFEHLIQILKKKNNFKIEMEFYSIYKEELYDSSKKWNDPNRNITIRQVLNTGYLNLLNCDRKSVNNIDEICKEFKAIWSNNQIYITACSGSLDSLNLINGCRFHVEQGEGDAVKKSMLEIFEIPFTTKSRKMESVNLVENTKIAVYQSNIKSLNNVVHALSSGHSHIPYRDSKLTRLMTNYLGGNSYCAMVCDNFDNIRLLKMYASIYNRPKIYSN